MSTSYKSIEQSGKLMLPELCDVQISAEPILKYFAPLSIYGSKVELEVLNFIHKLSTSVATTYGKFNQFDRYSLDLCTAPFCASFAAYPYLSYLWTNIPQFRLILKPYSYSKH
jgi:hypothetical protein